MRRLLAELERYYNSDRLPPRLEKRLSALGLMPRPPSRPAPATRARPSEGSSPAPEQRKPLSSAPASPPAQATPGASRPTPRESAQPPPSASTDILARHGSARLGDARLKFVNDGRGKEFCAGRVMVVNDGPYDVVDFRLGIEVSGITYALVPFEGSLKYPTAILIRRLRPGESMDCPVMTTGVYTSYSVHGVKRVVLEASLDGPPYVVADKKDLW